MRIMKKMIGEARNIRPKASGTIERIADENDGLGDNNIVLDRMVADLLDVLKETTYMRGIPDDDEGRNGYEKRLMAAIAKARGETE